MSPEYRSWANMIDRCERPARRDFKNYGGRGISVCRRWRRSFDAFLVDVGRRPSSRHTLGRTDNDGDYTPSNVRWETRLEQAANKRNNRNVTYQGTTMCLRAWARSAHINYGTLYARFVIQRQPFERALTTPVRQRRREESLCR